MKIVVIGGTIYARNRGVSAITVSAIKIIKKFIRDADVKLIHTFVESFYPKRTTSDPVTNDIMIVMDGKTCFKLAIIQDLLKNLLRIACAFIWRVFYTIGLNPNIFVRKKILKSYIDANIVINLSYGDAFAYTGSLYSLIVFISLTCQCLIGLLLKKPLIFFSQSIGPFKNGLTLFIAKFVLNKSKTIVARERISEAYLKEIGVKSPVLFSGDLAFCLEPVSHRRVHEILIKEGITKVCKDDTHIVGIALRNIYPEQPRLQGKYMDAITKVTNYLLSKPDTIVLLIPHTSAVRKSHCPRSLADLLAAKLEDKNKIVSITGEYTAEELKGLISLCDLFIGAFMHANIAAISMSIPTIGIGYSHKTYGIMEMVHLERYVWNVQDMSIGELITKVEDAWTNKDNINKHLMHKVKALKESSLLNGVILKKCLENETV